jgi:hypothetical protein
MEVQINVKMDNSAFVDNENELKEILIKIADKVVKQQQLSGTVNDSNGNRVATFSVED